MLNRSALLLLVLVMGALALPQTADAQVDFSAIWRPTLTTATTGVVELTMVVSVPTFDPALVALANTQYLNPIRFTSLAGCLAFRAQMLANDAADPNVSIVSMSGCTSVP